MRSVHSKSCESRTGATALLFSVKVFDKGLLEILPIFGFFSSAF
jgi:hypothetical protein